MKKYIETDKVKIIFEHILETDTRTFFDRGDELTDKVYSFVAKGLETLKSLPAADVQEVKHGRWIDNNDFWVNCSLCDCEVVKNEHDPLLRFTEKYNYCPNCGASMRGEEDE